MSSDSLRYDDMRQKSIHNAFQRHEGIPDQFLYWRIRSLEVDLHRADIFGDSPENDWAVYHSWHDPMSAISRFSQFLRICRGLNRAVPEHEVTTLFIDIKDPFPVRSDAKQSWKVFDALLDEGLGDLLYRPRDLLARAPGAGGLRDAVGAEGWPTLAELRGRFIAVLTGSLEQTGNYATTDAAALQRSAFLSMPVDSAGDIPGSGDTIFFNVNAEERMHLVDRVGPLGYVVRAYYVNDRNLWRQAVERGCHHIGTDKVNERMDGWAKTRNRFGFPFARVDGRQVDGVEAGSAIGVWARSDDLWSDADSFQFHYNRCSDGSLDNTYELAIASANSHIDDWAKGAVLARTGLDPDDAYFAVVRTAEKHGIRVQFRPDKSDQTTSTSRPLGPVGAFGYDLDQDTLVHVRLKVDKGGTRARAWASIDRDEWTQLGRFEFRKPLRYQGIGVSSHGQRRGAKFLFFAPGSDGAPVFEHSSFVGRPTVDHAGWVDGRHRGRWLTSGFSGYEPPN